MKIYAFFKQFSFFMFSYCVLCCAEREKMLMMTMFDICNDNVGVVVVAIISSYYVNKLQCKWYLENISNAENKRT